MATLQFDAELDLEQLDWDMKRGSMSVQNFVRENEKAGQQIENVYKRIGGIVGAYLTFDFAQGLSRDIVSVTGEFQKYAAVLENSLGSQQKAADAMEMLKTFATTTPFQLDELTGAYVKLVNQGFKPSESQMTKLGDLASSTGKGFDQLAEAMLDAQTGEFERLKEFGILASKQGDQVTFSFKGVQTQVDFTNQSIRDYIVSLGSMEGVMGANAKIAETMATQVSNLEDKITNVFASIGEKNKDEIGSILTMAGKAIDHYQDLIDVMKVLVATYGSYKAVLLITTALQNAGGIIANVRAWMQLAATIRTAKDAQIAFNLATSANPFGAIAAGIALVVSSLMIYNQRQREAAKEQSLHTKTQAEFAEKLKGEQAQMDSLIALSKNEKASRAERKKALDALKESAGGYLDKLTLENIGHKDGTELLRKYNDQLERKYRIEANESEIKALYGTLRTQNKGIALSQSMYDNRRKQFGDNSGEFGGQALLVMKKNLDELRAKAKQIREEIEKLLNDNVEASTPSKSTNTPADKKASSSDGKAYREQLNKLYSDINKDKQALMKEGSDKEMQAIKNEYADKINEINKQEQSLLEAYNKSKGLKKGDKGYLSQLPEEAKESIAQLKQLAETVKNSKELKLLLGGSDELVVDNSLESLLASTETFEQKRLNIVGTAMKDIADLENAGAYENAAIRRKQMNDSVKELEASNREKLKSFAYLYDSIDKWGKKALQARLDRINADLKNTELGDNEKLALEKALSETTATLASKAPLEAIRELNKRITDAKQKIAAANGDANKIKEAQKEIDESTAKKGAIMSETFGTVAGHLSNIASIAGEFNDELGQAIGLAADLASSLGDAISDIASKKDIIAMIVSAAGSIIKSVTDGEKRDKQKALEAAIERQKEANNLIDEANKKYEYQLSLLSKIKGVQVYDQIKKSNEELISSLGEAQKAIDKLDIKDKNTEYKDWGWRRTKLKSYSLWTTGWYKEYNYVLKYQQYEFDEINKLMKVALTTPDLSNIKAVHDEIDRIKGLIKGGTIFGDTDALNQQLENYTKMLDAAEELATKNAELLTGSTYDSILNAVVDAFSDGVMSAEEFASTFEDLMKKAVLNSMKIKFLEEPLKEWYADFAEAGEAKIKKKKGLLGLLGFTETVEEKGVYTAEEKEKLKADLKAKMDAAQKGFDQMKEITGIDFGAASGAKENSAVGIVKNLSENTGSEIVGNLTGMRYDIREQNMTIREHLAAMNESVSVQRAIEANTAATVRNLSMIGADISAIRGAVGSGNNPSAGRETGK